MRNAHLQEQRAQAVIQAAGGGLARGHQPRRRLQGGTARALCLGVPGQGGRVSLCAPEGERGLVRRQHSLELLGMPAVLQAYGPEG